MLVKMNNEGLVTVAVLIAGRSGTGKSTAAGAMYGSLIDNHFSVQVAHFATALKNTAYEVFGWDGEKDEKGRTLLQQLGNIGRQYDPNIWVDKLVLEYQRHSTDFLIIDDWRFPNEKTRIMEIPGVKVLTVRIEAPKYERYVGTLQYNDVSEVSLSDSFSNYDYTIRNNDTLGALELFARMIIDDIRATYGTMLSKGEE